MRRRAGRVGLIFLSVGAEIEFTSVAAAMRPHTRSHTTPGGLNEMESQPAYLRKNITLSNVPHSSDSQVSRYTLSKEEEDKSAEIKPNNSFLHDNVD